MNTKHQQQNIYTNNHQDNNLIHFTTDQAAQMAQFITQIVLAGLEWQSTTDGQGWTMTVIRNP